MLASTLGLVALPASKPHLQSLFWDAQGLLWLNCTFLLEYSLLMHRPLISIASLNVFTMCEPPSSTWRIEEKINSACLLHVVWQTQVMCYQHRRGERCYRSVTWCGVWRQNRGQSSMVQWVERPHGWVRVQEGTAVWEAEVRWMWPGRNSGMFWYWCYASRMHLSRRCLTNDLLYESLAGITGFGSMFPLYVDVGF